ncbi:MAG: zinc dependent phospholipase C family protein [Clostridium sp.]
MLIDTHIILANNILRQANGKKIYLINRRRFIWGNIKPDCASKYKFKKHYYDESITMILDKIKELASLSVGDIYYSFGKKKFSEELGVVCHFLCDFFCVPHNQRWEFKHSMKKHVVYEKNLAKFAKLYKFKSYIDSNLSLEDLEEFIVAHQRQYEKGESFRNDLEYSFFICNSVINMVLNEVYINEYASQKVVAAY